eukprot:1788334-Prymnesium_polylepis.1
MAKKKNGVLRAFSRAASARMVRGGRRALRDAQGVRAAQAPLNRQEGPGDGRRVASASLFVGQTQRQTQLPADAADAAAAPTSSGATDASSAASHAMPRRAR